SRAAFTVSRCSQVVREEPPRNESSLRTTWSSTSWATSSASASLPSSRRARPYTRGAKAWKTSPAVLGAAGAWSASPLAHGPFPKSSSILGASALGPGCCQATLARDEGAWARLAPWGVRRFSAPRGRIAHGEGAPLQQYLAQPTASCLGQPGHHL